MGRVEEKTIAFQGPGAVLPFILTLALENQERGEGSCPYSNGDHPDNNYLMLPESFRAPGLIGWDDFPCSNKAAISPPNRKMAEI